jgi:adenylate cyclase
MAEYKLIYNEGGTEYQYVIDKDNVEIGRLESNDLILNDFGISRNHAAIFRKGNKCFIKDKGSRNGTLVNNLRITETEITPGDVISLGRMIIQFEGPRENIEASAPILIDDGRNFDEAIDHTIIRPLKGDFEAEVGTMFSMTQPPTDTEPQKTRELKKQPNEIFLILSDVAKTLISLGTLDEILNTFMDMVFKYLPVDRGFLMLGNSEGELEPRLVKHRKPQKDQITISKTIAHKVFKDKVAILTTDAMMDPRFSSGDSIRFHGIRSAMCVPLWVEGEVVGILFVDSPMANVKFSEDDLNLLSSLGNYAAVAIQRARLAEKIKEEADARSKLERYHSPAVINKLLQEKGSEGVNIEAQEMESTVLFADIVGFTTFSEKMPPKQVALFLNEYFSLMTDVIFEYEGTLDKFLGDGLMAVFGAPMPYADHAIRATSAAIEMISQVEKLKQDATLGFELNIRIGINSGKVVAGDLGSPKRIEYTVLGDVVNVASRLEAYIAKPGEIVIGENTYKQVHQKFKTKLLGEIDLKGRSSKMKTYLILSRT